MANEVDDEGEDGSGQEQDWEVTDVLDLHTFRPRDVSALVRDYLEEASARGFSQVRIIHGKGVGTLRRIVHSALDDSALVASYQLAEPFAGGWGATIVAMKEKA